MWAVCGLMLVAVVAITVFGASPGTLFVYGIFLLCPLMHILMMRGHRSHGGARNHRQGVSHGPTEQASGGTSRNSCH
jgi:hypothetical protein